MCANCVAWSLKLNVVICFVAFPLNAVSNENSNYVSAGRPTNILYYRGQTLCRFCYAINTTEMLENKNEIEKCKNLCHSMKVYRFIGYFIGYNRWTGYSVVQKMISNNSLLYPQTWKFH